MVERDSCVNHNIRLSQFCKWQVLSNSAAETANFAGHCHRWWDYVLQQVSTQKYRRLSREACSPQNWIFRCFYWKLADVSREQSSLALAGYHCSKQAAICMACRCGHGRRRCNNSHNAKGEQGLSGLYGSLGWELRSTVRGVVHRNQWKKAFQKRAVRISWARWERPIVLWVSIDHPVQGVQDVQGLHTLNRLERSKCSIPVGYRRFQLLYLPRNTGSSIYSADQSRPYR